MKTGSSKKGAPRSRVRQTVRAGGRRLPGVYRIGTRIGFRFMIRGKSYDALTDCEDTERGREIASEMRRRAIDAVLAGEPFLARRLTFERAAAEFIDWARQEYREKPNTWKRLEVSMASLTEFFCGVFVDEINAGRLEFFKAWRAERGIKDVTIRHDLHAVSLLFQLGIKARWCDANPVREVRIPSDREARRDFVLTDAEEREYLAAAAEVSADLIDFARLILLQGLRPAEVLAIRRADVDFEARTLRVEKSKSAAGVRVLDLTSDALGILWERLRGREAPEWAFPSPRDRTRPRAYPGGLIKAHNRALERCGLSFVLYSLRHTFGTRLYQRTHDLLAVRAILGHGDLSTVQRYVHESRGDQVEAMRKFEAAARMDRGGDRAGEFLRAAADGGAEGE